METIKVYEQGGQVVARCGAKIRTMTPTEARQRAHRLSVSADYAVAHQQGRVHCSAVGLPGGCLHAQAAYAYYRALAGLASFLSERELQLSETIGLADGLPVVADRAFEAEPEGDKITVRFAE